MKSGHLDVEEIVTQIVANIETRVHEFAAKVSTGADRDVSIQEMPDV